MLSATPNTLRTIAAFPRCPMPCPCATSRVCSGAANIALSATSRVTRSGGHAISSASKSAITRDSQPPRIQASIGPHRHSQRPSDLPPIIRKGRSQSRHRPASMSQRNRSPAALTVPASGTSTDHQPAGSSTKAPGRAAWIRYSALLPTPARGRRMSAPSASISTTSHAWPGNSRSPSSSRRGNTPVSQSCLPADTVSSRMTHPLQDGTMLFPAPSPLNPLVTNRRSQVMNVIPTWAETTMAAGKAAIETAWNANRTRVRSRTAP